jgi:hypothetical protein
MRSSRRAATPRRRSTCGRATAATSSGSCSSGRREIAYGVAQRGEQVTVAFSRPGRIDLSAVRDRFSGWVFEAWADGGDAASQVTLRVLPDVTIRSFSLEDDRVVVVDVFGGSTSQGLAPPASDLAEDPIGELRRELEQRDAVIDSLLAQSSNSSGMPSCLGTTSITSRPIGRPRPVGGRSRNRGRHR